MLNSEDLAVLRERIHRSVDAILDEFLALHETLSFVASTRADHDTFPYTWPDRTVEQFTHGVWYNVLSTNTEIAQFLVAQTERDAWGRSRPRYVVFLQGRGKNSTTIYPLTEFVQVDRPGNTHFAAKIPNPQHPQKFLKEHDPVPPELSGATILPVEQLFENVQEAKSLRRVIDLQNNGMDEILQHAFWIGRMKKRF